MEKGFIKLSRSFFDNKIWQAARAFSECEAWLDLIQSARFEASPTTSRIGCYEVTWERGQYPASNRFLAKKWGRSEQWVKSFLGKLKREHMIVTDNSQGVNVITLVNYSKYNGDMEDNNPPNNSPNNPLKDMDYNKLQGLVTHLVTHLITHPCENMGENGDNGTILQPTPNPNNKKEEEYNNNYSLRSSNELLCGTSQSHEERIDYRNLVSFFNDTTKGVFGNIRYPLSDKRKGMINARIKEHGKKAFVEMIRKAYESNFLKGQNSRNFTATFDWLIKPTNFEKVISGNYDNKNSGTYASGNDGDEDFMRNIAEGIARGNFEKQRRGDVD